MRLHAVDGLRRVLKVRDVQLASVIPEGEAPVVDGRRAEGAAFYAGGEDILADGGEGAGAHLVEGEDTGGFGGDAEADEAGGGRDEEGGVGGEV